MSLAGVFVNLAKALFWALRIILAVISFCLGLCSCFVPWRIPSLSQYSDADDLNSFTGIGFALLGISLLDVAVACLFMITVVTWRMPRMVSKLTMTCDFPGRLVDMHNREAIGESFMYMVTDIPFIIMGLLTHITFWRIPRLYGSIRSSEWRKEIFDTFKVAMSDIPCALIAALLVLIPWRLRKAIRLYKKISTLNKDDYDWKRIVLIQFGKGVTELILVPFMIPVILTGYRLKNTWKLLLTLQDTDEDDASARCNTKMDIMREGCMVFIDFGCLILLVITALLFVRISALIDVVKNRKTKPKPRLALLKNFLLSFRELLAVVVYIILIPCFYRFWFAFSNAIEASSSSADPKPHAVISTMTIEYPAEGGIKIHLSGTKLSDLQFSTAKLYIKNKDFWDAVGSMSTIAKTFLPLKLTPEVFCKEDFCNGEKDFSTTLYFKVAKEKVFRKHINDTIGAHTNLRIAVEFDDQSGTLFDISFTMNELLRGPDHLVDIDQPVSLFESDASSKSLRESGKKIPGEKLCDVMAIPAFIQLGLMVVDIAALVLFILLHLVPTRVYTLYRRIMLGSSEAITRDKFIVAKNKMSKLLKRRCIAEGSAKQIIDKGAKTGRLGSFTLRIDGEEVRPWYYTSYNRRRLVNEEEDKEYTDAMHFFSAINTQCKRISELPLPEAKSLSETVNQFTARSTTAILHYSFAVAQHYRYTHGDRLTYTGASAPIEHLNPLLCNLNGYWPTTDKPSFELITTDKKTIIRGRPSDFVSQRSYSNFMEKQREADEAFQNLVNELNSPMTAGTLSCKHFSPSAVKSEVYRTTKDFAVDFAAFLAAVVVACTVYRLPVIIRELKNCRSGEVRQTIFNNLVEIPIDFMYLLKALVVIAFLRSAVPMITNVIHQAVQRKSFHAMRMVVDHYLLLTAYDVHILFAFVLCWNTIAWGFGCAVFGLLLPGAMFTWMILGKPGEGCCETFCVLLGTAWFYGFPIVAGLTLLGDGNQTAVFGSIFGVLGLFLLLFTISWMWNTESQELNIVHGIFLRWNWFNGLQFAYTTIECIQVVGLLVLSHYKDGSDDISGYVYDFFKASLMYYPEQDNLSIIIALSLAMVFYFVAAVPVTALALESDAKVVTHTGWIFLMELLSQGLLPFIIYQLTDYVMCEPAEFCWSGEHRRLGIFALLVLVFFIIASYAKPPEYTTSHCKLLDCVFVEGYVQVAKYSLIAVVIVSVALRGDSSFVYIAVALHCAWTLFWTTCYPRLFNISRVCSSDFYTWFKVISYSAVLISTSYIQHGIPGCAAAAGAVIILCIVLYRCGFSRDDDELRRSPEQIQSDLLSLHSELSKNGCLVESFTTSGGWRKSVPGCIRVSQLASLILQLEEAIQYQHLDPMFLSVRSSWKKSLDAYISSEDSRQFIDDYYYYERSWYWWGPCLNFFLGFLCCCVSMSGLDKNSHGEDENENENVANTPAAFADIHTKFQQMKNGMRFTIIPETGVMEQSEQSEQSDSGNDTNTEDCNLETSASFEQPHTSINITSPKAAVNDDIENDSPA